MKRSPNVLAFCLILRYYPVAMFHLTYTSFQVQVEVLTFKFTQNSLLVSKSFCSFPFLLLFLPLWFQHIKYFFLFLKK